MSDAILRLDKINSFYGPIQVHFDLTIEITGRAAHAGVEPELGRSAIVEAAHKTIELHALNGRWPGVSVNVGVIGGGTRTNVVAERSTLEVDLRAADESSLVAAEPDPASGIACAPAVVASS